MTSKERVYETLSFSAPDRIPVDIWVLPAAYDKYGQQLIDLIDQRNIDFALVPILDPTADPLAYETGFHYDVWGCGWQNHQKGIIGEVKEWPLADDKAVDSYKSPVNLLRGCKDFYTGTYEYLSKVKDKFNLCGWVSLFERMQYLRGTENLYVDIALESDEFFKIRDMVMEYWCVYIEMVCKIEEIDAVTIGDDWGSQRSLLISPESWRNLFKPCYKQLIDLIRSYGKKAFIHSDGNILEIYDDWIELGVSAINSQVWCMGIENVAQKCAGKITLWGEVDRQHILPVLSPEEVVQKIGYMKENFYKNGGLIGQFETGRDVSLENIKAALYAW